MIPLFDINRQYQLIKDEINRALLETIESGKYILGPDVREFEERFASYQRTRYCVGASSGTGALQLALLALGIGPGDEVITVPNTFVATAEAVTQTGAQVVFVDVDEKSYTMDPNLLEAAVTPKTRVILPVHLYGQMADMDPILEIARKHGLAVVEDAAQAHGAEYRGKRAGEISHSACFSFFPTKNLGAFGDGGALVTNDEDLARKARAISDHGRGDKHNSIVHGHNNRLDSLQAAVLKVKLPYMDRWNDMRRQWAHRLSELLSDADVIRPHEMDYATHIYHLYIIQSDKRDALAEYLHNQGVITGIHYKVPIHLQKAYSGLGKETGSFPVSENLGRRILSLPMFPELTEDEIVKLANAIIAFKEQ
ncbi:MAG: glutamine--scyllo-inositol aminotransferase [Nitrospinaceae bacterium]|nr:MAG: glutamine--scyllo-inositol aminotransferase [Nitrospinaceae bacterium]